MLRMFWKSRRFIAIVFNFAVEYAIRKVHANREGLKLNGTYQFLEYAANVNM